MFLLIAVELTKLRAKWIDAIGKSPRAALIIALLVCAIFPLIYRGVERVEFIYFQF